MLRLAVETAVGEVVEAARGQHLSVPPVEVTLHCPGFWRRGRGHG